MTGRISTPSPHRTCPERCGELGHPGVTFNPWTDRTYCLCGEHAYVGKASTVDEHLACCGGPLTEPVMP